jgi:NAD(P)-dependent dehydrogenase (short-subunit alcohol dehydrogenase family)
MGKAMAAQALHEGRNVLGISRKPATSLLGIAQASDATLEEWQCDLTDAEAAAERLSRWLAAITPGDVSSISLINNAALLSSPAPLHVVPPAELVAALRVGLEAPVLLTRAFLATTQAWINDAGWNGDRRVLQISSGLGRFAMASVGSYCAIKAGLDNFSASVALDQQQLGDAGAKIVSLAPGIIATDMQAQLRNADGGGFPDQSTFVDYHESGALDSPEAAAAKVLGYLARADFGSTVIARL